jgi:hypothetical protein
MGAMRKRSSSNPSGGRARARHRHRVSGFHPPTDVNQPIKAHFLLLLYWELSNIGKTGNYLTHPTYGKAIVNQSE